MAAFADHASGSRPGAARGQRARPMGPVTLSADVMFARLMAKARLRQLQLLVAIADESSLKRGAEDIFMSQPAATQALAELEQLLELPLFERHAKGMRLTAGGEALIPVVRSVLETLRDSTISLELLHRGARGQLRVGAISAVATMLVNERVLGFCRGYPDLRVVVVEDVQDHLVQRLLTGGLDLALTRRPLPMPQRLHFELLGPEEPIVVAGPGHPLAARRGLVLDDLLAFRWMRATRGLWVRRIFDDLFDRAGAQPRLHPLSVGSLGPLIEILRDNETIALLPASLGHTLQRWGLAAVLDARLDVARGELGFLRPHESLDDPMLNEFVDALRAS